MLKIGERTKEISISRPSISSSAILIYPIIKELIVPSEHIRSSYKYLNLVVSYQILSMQGELSQYKKIHIQDIQRKDQPHFHQCNQDLFIQKLDRPADISDYYKGHKKGEGEVYFYRDTGTDQNRKISKESNFFKAFYYAYQNHGDLILVPDDIWLTISVFLARYIEKHAEKLRREFVSHEGQKGLTVIENVSSVEESLEKQKEWDNFFDQIIKQIEKNTIEGVVGALKCDFSTTDKAYELISTSIIMSSFKQYFTYMKVIMMCGISNVYFGGIREDWTKLINKLNFLNKYDVDGDLTKYITNVRVILQKLLDTFDGKPDVPWWNTIMTSEERFVGSGSANDTYVQGWILHFYGIYDKVEVGQIPSTATKVPITLINECTKMKKNLELITDFVSVSKYEKYAYKPDMGMCIIERSRQQLG